MNRVKPLTLKELELKEEMKARCLNKGQYIDEKAKDKFYMLCHLEDFEVQYYDLLQENNQLKEELKKADSLTQSCIFDGKEESQLNFRKAINITKELRTWLEEEINICDGVISTRTSDFQELSGRSAGKTFIQTEILKNKVALKSFELALNKLNELEGNNE